MMASIAGKWLPPLTAALTGLLLVSCMGEQGALPTEVALAPSRVMVNMLPEGTCPAGLVAIPPVVRAPIQVDLKYPLNLKAASQTINVLSSASFDPAGLETTTLTLGDGVGRDVYRTASASAGDLNKDGRADLKLTFATKDLVASGALSSTTSPLVLLGYGAAAGLVRGVPAGVTAPVVECRRPVTININYPIEINSNEMWLDVLSTANFDAADINIGSVFLSDGAGRAVFRHRAGTDDVNRDGRTDAQLSFKPKELQRLGVLASSSSRPVLLAFTSAGPIWGTVAGVPEPEAGSYTLVLEPATVNLVGVGESVKLKAQIVDKKGAGVAGQKITWTTADAAVVTVDETGKVTATGQGTTVVTADWQGLKAQATVTVRPLAPADKPVAITINLVYPIDLTEDELWIDVLSTADVDATKIEPSTVTLNNAAGKSVKKSRAGTDDVNKDGLVDAQFSFKVEELLEKGVVTTPVDGPLAMLGYSKAVGHLRGTPNPNALPQPSAFTLTVEPKTLILLKPGESGQLTAAIENRKGKKVPGLKPAWKSLDETLLQVDSEGKVTGKRAGTGQVAAVWMGLETKVTITVKPAGPPALELPPQSGDFVTFPSAEWEVLIGPQLRSGRGANPWPWFDQTAISMGMRFGDAFPATPNSTDAYILDNYYDQGLVQYTNYFRTGDARFLEYARKITDSWWQRAGILPVNGVYDDAHTPRDASLGGVILRAMDGKPEYWPGITGYVRAMYEIWVGLRLTDSEPYLGVRDGGYMLLYAAWLGRVHPDAAVRAEFRDLALRGARDYYARLQMPDGSWRWSESVDGNPGGLFSQPLMIGILLEGMIATHQLTGDATVRQAILRAVDNLYTVGYRTDSFDLDGNGTMDGKWRGMWYFTYGNLCSPPVPGPCGEATRVRDGDTNVILEVRQLNPLTLHAFGYAYHLTNDTKYRTWGDEIFSATFGGTQGPGADGYTNLAAWGERGKEYNQSYRTSGRYLAWRTGQ